MSCANHLTASCPSCGHEEWYAIVGEGPLDSNDAKRLLEKFLKKNEKGEHTGKHRLKVEWSNATYLECSVEELMKKIGSQKTILQEVELVT